MEDIVLEGRIDRDELADRMGRRFALVAVFVPLAVVIASGVAVALLAALVDENASAAGFSTGFTPFAALSLGGLAVFVALIAASVEQFPADRIRHEPWPITIASAAGITAIVSTCFGPTAPTWPMLPISLAVGALAAVLAYLVVVRTRSELQRPTSTVPPPFGALRRGISAERTAVWSGRVPRTRILTYSWLAAAAFLVVVVIGTNRITGATVSSLGSLFFLLNPMLISGTRMVSQRVRVTVGPSGIIIRNGLTRRVSYAVGLEHIDSAWITVAPKVGLWTNYGKQSSARRLSFLSRKGPALLVRLTDGTDIVVALDGPEEAAGIINDLLDRRVRTPPAAASR